MNRCSFVLAMAFLVMGITGAQAQAQEDKYPNKVKTHIGELTFDHGIPTEETSKKLYYEMDYHRAVQTYLWSLPIVGQAQWRQSYLDLYGMKPKGVSRRLRIHGTNDPKSIGRSASSGCFRMMNRHVMHLSTLVNIGTEVRVVARYRGAS